MLILQPQRLGRRRVSPGWQIVGAVDIALADHPAAGERVDPADNVVGSANILVEVGDHLVQVSPRARLHVEQAGVNALHLQRQAGKDA